MLWSPICYDSIARLCGFKMGGDTWWVHYLKYSKFITDEDRPYGSAYDWTIYWQYIGKEIFYAPFFTEWLKIGMLSVNVWYFFVRRWCLPRCVENLINTRNQDANPILS